MSYTATAEPGYETEIDETPAEDELDGDQYEVESDANTDASDGEASEEDTPGSGESKPKTGSAQPKSNRALYRRVAAKTIEVQQAPASVRSLAASMLSCPDDTVELVTSIMGAPRTAQAPLTDIDTLQATIRDEPWGAGIKAAEMSRPRIKAMWSLLHVLGAIGTPAPPASDAKAALAAIKAVNALTDDNNAELAAAGSLLKRS